MNIKSILKGCAGLIYTVILFLVLYFALIWVTRCILRLSWSGPVILWLLGFPIAIAIFQALATLAGVPIAYLMKGTRHFSWILVAPALYFIFSFGSVLWVCASTVGGVFIWLLAIAWFSETAYFFYAYLIIAIGAAFEESDVIAKSAPMQKKAVKKPTEEPSDKDAETKNVGVTNVEDKPDVDDLHMEYLCREWDYDSAESKIRERLGCVKADFVIHADYEIVREKMVKWSADDRKHTEEFLAVKEAYNKAFSRWTDGLELQPIESESSDSNNEDETAINTISESPEKKKASFSILFPSLYKASKKWFKWAMIAICGGVILTSGIYIFYHTDATSNPVTGQTKEESQPLLRLDETSIDKESGESSNAESYLYDKMAIDYYIAHKILMDIDSAMASPEVRWYQQKYKFRFLTQEDSLVFDCERAKLIHSQPVDTASLWDARQSTYYLWKQIYYQRLVDYESNR